MGGINIKTHCTLFRAYTQHNTLKLLILLVENIKHLTGKIRQPPLSIFRHTILNLRNVFCVLHVRHTSLQHVVALIIIILCLCVGINRVVPERPRIAVLGWPFALKQLGIKRIYII